MNEAYPYWRVLTTHLLYPRSRQTHAAVSPSAQGADEVIQKLSAAFHPWSKSAKGGASAPEHLRSVLQTATETGLMIMSQPSTFSFEWNVPTQAAGAIVVLPAFEKTADERGSTLSQKYVLAEPKVETIS